MIKHLPEGLTPFEDCGFARYPLYPLDKEPFELKCRVDDNPNEPVLLWSVDGVTQAPLKPTGKEERSYRFAFGGYPYGTMLTYAFQAGREISREYTLPICRETTLYEPISLAAQGGAAALRFTDGISLRFEAGEQLHVFCSFDNPSDTQTTDSVCSLSLPNDFSLTIRLRPFLCVLKRSSKTILSMDIIQVLWDANGKARRITQRWKWSPTHVWGTGERYDAVDQRGRVTNGCVTEKFTRQGDQTYLPIPFFMTNDGFGWYRSDFIPAAMQFGDCLQIVQEIEPNGATHDVLFFGTPKTILSQYILLTGKPVLPPEWSFGVWISANGWRNDAEVDAQLEALRKYDYPASVMVLEAWSDERTFYRWNGDGSWLNPADTVKRIRDAGLHLLLWQIPIIKYEWDGKWGEALLADEREAIDKGYCVLNDDGTPYRITENWFHNSLLLDFTNPDALRWWFKKRKYLLDMGVEGFKTDGGEFLFDHAARLHDGTPGLAAHNLYPTQYIGAYHGFLRQNGVNGLTFSRAGFVGAQTQPMHWAGDQLSRWSELKSQLNAGISAGLSGVILWGFDIGGFAGELPTAELYLRATAMACFCPVMQWHSEPRDGQFYRSHEKGFNNDRSPWNLAEKLHDSSVLTVATRFARIREKLRPYLVREAGYCAEHNRPMMAHLCIDFPRDERACAIDDQYMLGRSLLVAPITREGDTGREVYLPQGDWVDVFTHERFTGGQSHRAECDITRIPVYRRSEGDNANEA